MTLGDLLKQRALEHPHRAALIVGGAEISYQTLYSASARLACWLLRQGLRPGDRMAIHWHNSFEAAMLYFAAFQSGIIAVPVNLRLKAPEIAYIFENSGASLCFSAPPFAPLAQAAASSCPPVRTVLSAIPTEAPAADLPVVDPAQTAVILYTSGTTARPKGSLWSHRTFVEICRSIETQLPMTGGIGLATTPMMHISALLMVVGSIYGGAATVLLPGFDPAAILDAIERHRCNFTMSLPALLQFIVDEQARKPRDVSSLHNVLAGGDSVPLALQRRFQELFGIPLQEFYGQTEGGFIAINPRESIREGSMGIPLPTVQLRIVDPSGHDVPEGDTGEVVLRSPAHCCGYWNDPQATASLMRDGWLCTGDLAGRDTDGRLWFRGRAKQIIVRAGSNISPQEVEEALYQHPAVRETGVVGKPDPVYGELVIAFVALREGNTGVTESELREYARERLADYKVPEQILIIAELPKGLTGKVDRRALKEHWLADHGASAAG